MMYKNKNIQKSKGINLLLRRVYCVSTRMLTFEPCLNSEVHFQHLNADRNIQLDLYTKHNSLSYYPIPFDNV